MIERMRPAHWALACALSALLGWQAASPVAQAPALVQTRRDEWSLPTLPLVADATTRAVIVSTSPIWGAEVKPADTAASAPNLRWRLAGVFGSGKTGRALIVFEDPAKPEQRLKVGDKLPSGHPIELIESNQVCIKVGKKQLRFGVETRE